MSKIVITKPHAKSLINLVKWFKARDLVKSGQMVSLSGQSGPEYNFHSGYCDELIDSLGVKSIESKEISNG